MPFYVTTPIYSVNDAPHLGHAYSRRIRRRGGGARVERITPLFPKLEVS